VLAVGQTFNASGFSFFPPSVTVNVGDQVTWNLIDGFHTVTSGLSSNPPDRPGALFDAPLDPGNTTFVYRVLSCGERGNGSIAFFCRPHEFFFMRGTINVNPILSSVGMPRVGTTVNLPIACPFQAGRSYFMAASLGSAGLEVAGGRIVPLSPDGIFLISLGANFPPFIGFLGVLNGSGGATPQFQIPGIPQLAGTAVNFACVTIDPPAPGGIGAVSNLVSLTIQP
jgi:plastocyanin